MPGKGSTKGKGKESKKTTRRDDDPPKRTKWKEDALQTLFNTIMLHGKIQFRILNWDLVHSEFAKLMPDFTKNSCQSKWSNTLHERCLTALRNGVNLVNKTPQPLPLPFAEHAPEDLPADNSKVEGTSYTDSPRNLSDVYPDRAIAGSSHGAHASCSSPSPAAPYGTPRRSGRPLSPLQEEDGPATPFDAPNTQLPVCYLYDQFGQNVGKIEIRDGFRLVEIKGTLSLSLPLPSSPAAADPLAGFSGPDLSQIDPQIVAADQHLTPDTYDENPLYHEAHRLSIDEFIDSGAFGSPGQKSEAE